MSSFPIEIHSSPRASSWDGSIIEVGRIPVEGDYLEVEKGGRICEVLKVVLLQPGGPAARITLIG